MSGYYYLYKDNRSEWRWQYVSSNGRVIAVSSEGYKNRLDCLNAIRIMQGSYNSPIRE
jgi:uncharacterized protein YegP (UPF0339 family)